MTKSLNQNLLKSLLSSDFLLLEQKMLPGQSQRLQNSFFIDKKVAFFLDPLEISMAFKQLIRFLQHLKKHKNLKKELHFFLDEDDTTISSFIKTFLKNNSINSLASIVLNSNKHNSIKKSNRNHSRIGFILDSACDKNFFRKQFNKDILYLFKIDSRKDINSTVYTIQATFSDYKKIIFFLSFLRQLLKRVFNTI